MSTKSQRLKALYERAASIQEMDDRFKPKCETYSNQNQAIASIAESEVVSIFSSQKMNDVSAEAIRLEYLNELKEITLEMLSVGLDQQRQFYTNSPNEQEVFDGLTPNIVLKTSNVLYLVDACRKTSNDFTDVVVLDNCDGFWFCNADRRARKAIACFDRVSIQNDDVRLAIEQFKHAHVNRPVQRVDYRMVARDAFFYYLKATTTVDKKAFGKWWDLRHALATVPDATRISFMNILGRFESVTGPLGDKIVESMRRLTFTMVTFKTVGRKDAAIVVQEMIRRAFDNRMLLRATIRLERVAAQVYVKRKRDPPHLVAVSLESTSFGECLWPYLGPHAGYALMASCKALRMCGIDHNRRNQLLLVGFNRRAQLIDGSTTHSHTPFVVQGTQLRFTLCVRAGFLQWTGEKLQRTEFVFDKCGTAVNMRMTRVDVQLVNDNFERTNAAPPNLHAHEVFVRRDLVKSAAKNTTAPTMLLAIKLLSGRLSGRERRRFRLQFTLHVQTERFGRQCKFDPWIVESEAFVVVSKNDSENAIHKKRVRDNNRLADLRMHTQSHRLAMQQL